MQTIGVREFKARLSHHLRRVRAGHGLIVTDRGRPVASIQPVDAPRDTDWVRVLVAEGKGAWGTGKPKGTERPIAAAPGKRVSDIVGEDRR
jgi:prevent-host-death family protein